MCTQCMCDTNVLNQVCLIDIPKQLSTACGRTSSLTINTSIFCIIVWQLTLFTPTCTRWYYLGELCSHLIWLNSIDLTCLSMCVDGVCIHFSTLFCSLNVSIATIIVCLEAFRSGDFLKWIVSCDQNNKNAGASSNRFTDLNDCFAHISISF